MSKPTEAGHNQHGLLEYHQLPPWRQMNEFITGGYRPISHSYKPCFSSFGFFHTESGSQYTHFLPFFLATAECLRVLGILYGWIEAPYTPRKEDILAFGAFFLGTFTCMGLSTVYHTFMCHSQKVASFMQQLDFLGIVSLIWGSLVPTIYYTFTCEVDLMRRYLMTLSTVSLLMAIFLLSPLARKPWGRPLVTPGFVALAATGIIPLAHGIQLYGWQRMSEMVGIEKVLAQGLIYAFGLLCMVSRLPERLMPGKFNFYGHSHHLFHAAVVVAAIVHYLGIRSAFLFQHSYPQAAICPMKSLWKDDVLALL